jgi:Protein of unknown function (DUF2934)
MESTAKSKVGSTPTATATRPTEEAVRLRAYYLYLERERDGHSGTETDDWLLAEAELADEIEQSDSSAHLYEVRNR